MAAAPLLVHFGVYTFHQAFWALSDAERAQVASQLKKALVGVADPVHLYGTFGTRADCDALAWSSVNARSPDAPDLFFATLTRALRPFRRYVHLVDALWGFTRESEYARGGGDRSIDPSEEDRSRYLVVYPFAKTHVWYRVDAGERRRIMSEHIRVGRRHEGVSQLLLYSAGLQDHEFVVVYETDDLAGFSRLVAELRGTEARGYTLLDTPVRIGFYRPLREDQDWL